MKKKYQILIILFFLVYYAGCKDDSANNKTTRIEQDKKQLQETTDNKVILQINENKFTNKDLKNYIRLNYPDLFELNDNLRLASRIFDSFSEQKIIQATVKSADIHVPDEEYKQYTAKLNIRNEKNDRESIIDSIKLQKYLDMNVYKDIDVSSEEIREYYNKNHDEFTKKREVLLYQIFLKDKEKAFNIWSILQKEPEKFEELATSYSESIEAKSGGLLGYFEKGILPKEMEDVVFSLKLNKISPVTESPYGFHIFKITNQKRGGRLLYIKNVEAEIKDKLLALKLSEAYRDFLEKLKDEMHIDIRYNELYFKYQALKGENKDEITQDNAADNTDNNSSQ